MDDKALQSIQRLVGDITRQELKYVDCYIAQHLGMFVPSVGFCEYAIRPQHTHPAYSFVLFFSPETSLVPVTVEVLPNHYLVTAMSPQVAHQEDAADGFTRYIAILIDNEFFEKHYNEYSSKSPESYFWKQFIVEHDIMIYLKKFMSEYENKQLGYEQVLESLADIITHQLLRGVLEIATGSDLVIDRLEIEKAIEYMQQNYGDKLTVGSLAKLINMSESHFIRIFKQEMRLAPIEYLIKLRIEKAKKLLRSRTKTITEIALQCGFNSTSHFSSCFVKQMGTTPTDYQNLYSK